MSFHTGSFSCITLMTGRLSWSFFAQSLGGSLVTQLKSSQVKPGTRCLHHSCLVNMNLCKSHCWSLQSTIDDCIYVFYEKGQRKLPLLPGLPMFLHFLYCTAKYKMGLLHPFLHLVETFFCGFVSWGSKHLQFKRMVNLL